MLAGSAKQTDNGAAAAVRRKSGRPDIYQCAGDAGCERDQRKQQGKADPIGGRLARRGIRRIERGIGSVVTQRHGNSTRELEGLEKNKGPGPGPGLLL